MPSIRRYLGVTAIGLLTPIALVPAAVGQTYELIDVGTLGGPVSSAWGINNAGQVVGTSATADAALHAFLWQGTMTDIGPLAGDEQAQAFDINDAGEAAIMSFDLGELVTQGLLWESTSSTDLGGLAARDVNANGMVVGHVSSMVPDTGAFDRAAKWEAGVTTTLASLGGDFSYGRAVNDAGDVVGMSLLAGNGSWHAALFDIALSMDLGTLGGDNSQAFDINGSRQVVGVADTASGHPHAFLFTLNATGLVTSRTDLGTLDGAASYAHAINEGGAVVGTSGFRAFRWHGATMTDLNTLLPSYAPWKLEIAHDINDAGSMVGQGTHAGQPRGFLLSVTEACVSVDADQDGDVDLRDFSAFLLAFQDGAPLAAGPGTADICIPVDADGNSDVDLTDLYPFISALARSSGPGSRCPKGAE